MKNLFSTILLSGLLFVGCSKEDIAEQNDPPVLACKSVSISANMGADDESRASIDSKTGAFTWQDGDVISVLATDGKFYDFTLEGEANVKTAEFVGSIPETANITSVATYPSLVANGTENTIYVDGVLNYTLPAEWTYVEGASNVPMVAKFDEGATHIAFKQVGGIMRFPVKNLPTQAKFTITVNGSGIVGPFHVDVATLGESYMTADESESSTVTINYSSVVDGASAEFNVPVPVGTYDDFTVKITDADGNDLLTKSYNLPNNHVSRAALAVLRELKLAERPMVISEVWPFFVDARVVFGQYEGVSKYALYIDGAETPVIETPEVLADDRLAVLIGGEFDHNTKHTVAVAKVVDDEVVADSKSEPVEFTTGRVMQMTYNTGTKFICAAWDDVAIGIENSTVYDEQTKKWSMVANDGDVTDRNMRGYRVQLCAADGTVLYDEVPFSGQCDYGGAISSSSWIGKIGGANVLLPTALSFGWLEPGTKYYFRVQTLAEPVTFDSPETGNFDPDSEAITITSTRGGCGWSKLVEMTTDAPHVASANEVLYEGFDDMMFNSDIMNICSAVVPQMWTEATEKYASRSSAQPYKAWVELPFAERKFSEQGFNTMLGVYYHGLTDDKYTNSSTLRYLNEYAGSLEGWSVISGGSDKRTVNPNFGSVRLGQSGGSAGKVALRTAPIMSDKLSETVPTKCIITVKVSAHATTSENVNAVLGVYHYRGETTLDNKNTIQFNLDENGAISSEWSENYTWTDMNNYIHYSRWFEVKTELNLLKGDVIGFEKANPKVNGVSDFYKGCVTLGEITIEVAPTVNEFEDDGVGTEPDDTNYDVYGLGEFPISYWYTVEPSSYVKIDETTGQAYYDYDLTKARYQEVKDSGINIALYYGHGIDRSITENKRLHDICAEVGLKFIGNVWAADNATRIQQIKETFGNSTTYVGELLRDEPSVEEYDGLGAFVDAYNTALPDKEVYINLFPEYANAATQLKTDYEDYIEQYLAKVKTKSVSYDYYGLHKTNGNVFNDFYSNLDVVRSKTLDARKPFWVITQAGIAGSAKMPNELEQRWSVWANIAGGSKGISYFCYWTPSGGNYNNNGFMIDINGNKQDMYYWVKQINADINTIGKKLLPCHADGTISSSTTYYPLYDNNGAGRTKYGPVQKVSAINNHVAVGCFRDARRSENGDNYKGYKVMVVAHQPARAITTALALDTSVTTITVTQNNETKVVELNNQTNVKVIDGEKGINLSYTDGKLTLDIPEGEALLIEF